MPARHIVVPAGGIGAARFLRGIKAALGSDAEITVIGNTGDDITLFGLRICPDLDTVMYTLGGGIEESQGWGRAGETFAVRDELAAYDAGPSWFGLGDHDLATHIVRSAMLDAGAKLSEVTETLCARWAPGVRLLPMSDDRVETQVEIEDEQGRRWLHFQEYWVRLRAQPPALAVHAEGAATAMAAPGVLESIAAADVVLVPPSNPVVSIGIVLAVPGIADALRATAAPVVGVSPIIGGAPVRGMADKLLPSIGVAVSAEAVARHYGARNAGGILDGWLVDTADADAATALSADGLPTRALPLLMTDVAATATMARAALELAEQVRR